MSNNDGSNDGGSSGRLLTTLWSVCCIDMSADDGSNDGGLSVHLCGLFVA